ncbi:MAG TPA: MFS transporter [Acidimicrobiia bacterium]|nr:MFS transporter [Acidimicrobiia bacterium]
MAVPRSILSPQLLPASIAIFTTVAIVAFEGLAITAALPEVAGDLGNVEFLPWIITSFLLASAVATAVSGTLIDTIGTSTVFRWATTLFAASSLVAAAANSMAILVASRIVQGAAGGAIISVGIAAVALVYPGHLTGRALAANSNVWGVLGFASPAIAAALLEIGSWRWIFLLMAPICLIALAAGWRTLPKAVEPTPLVVDWLSAGLLVLTVGFLLAAVSDISTTSIVLVAAGTISGTVLWRRLRRTDSPLVDPQYLQAAPYAHLAASASLALAAIGGLSAYLPVYVRGARGGSASLAAWSVLWMTIGWTFAANIAGRVTDRVPERTVLAIGAVLGPIGVVVAWLTVALSAPLPIVFASYFLMGTAVGTVTNAALQLVRRVVPPALAGRATSAHAFLRTMGMSLGAGLAGGTILAVTATRLSDVSEVEAALTGTGDTLAGSAANALANGFQVAHLASLVLVVVGAVVTWRIYERLPASGHDRNPA